MSTAKRSRVQPARQVKEDRPVCVLCDQDSARYNCKHCETVYCSACVSRTKTPHPSPESEDLWPPPSHHSGPLATVCPVCRQEFLPIIIARYSQAECPNKDCEYVADARSVAEARDLVKQHLRNDCAYEPFGVCRGVPRKDLVEHLLQCSERDCRRLAKIVMGGREAVEQCALLQHTLDLRGQEIRELMRRE